MIVYPRTVSTVEPVKSTVIPIYAKKSTITASKKLFWHATLVTFIEIFNAFKTGPQHNGLIMHPCTNKTDRFSSPDEIVHARMTHFSQLEDDCRLVDAKQVASSAIDVRAVIDVRHGSCS